MRVESYSQASLPSPFCIRALTSASCKLTMQYGTCTINNRVHLYSHGCKYKSLNGMKSLLCL